MSGIVEKLKHIPIPIWIGLGLVLILIIFMSSKSSSSGSTAGPVTSNTMGSSGSQPGAGTDQELGNLSQITQAGFADISKNEQTNTGLLQAMSSSMSGVGTGMTQFGGAVQSTQNGSAQTTAANYSGGQPVNNHPSNQPSPTSLFNVPIVDASGGTGTIQVVAHDAASAVANAHQGGNTPTGSATPV
jgi:hypothetical protein